MSRDYDVGTLNIKTKMCETEQMSGFQNATLSGTQNGVAVSIAIYPNYPDVIRSQDEVKGYLAAKLSPLVLEGWSVEVAIGDDLEIENNKECKDVKGEQS